MNSVKINEGLTYEYVRHGLASFIIGGLLVFLHPIFLIPGFGIGILLILTSTGIEVDLKNNRIRKFKKFLLKASGKTWYDLTEMEAVILRYNANGGGSFGNFDFLPVPRPLILPVPRTAKTFDMFFIIKGSEPIEFNQFNQYSLAVKTIKAIPKLEGLVIVDQFAEKLAKKSARK